MAAAGWRCRITEIGFIGYGEVGYRFSLGFKEQGLTLAAYAPIPPNPEGVKEKARQASVRLVPSLKDLIDTSEIIFCCVWPASALAVAGECAGLLKPSQFYLDVNSVSPHTAAEIAALVAPSGAEMVKFAIMYPVPAHGFSVPILAAGAKAEAIASQLNGYGMNITVLGTDPGGPAAIKILRAACLKGMTALLMEALLAAEKYGLREETLNYISETFDSPPFSKIADDWISSTAVHAARRAGEMDEALQAISDVGLPTLMTRATKQSLEEVAAMNLAQKFGDEWAPSYAAVLQAMLQAED